MAIIHHPLGKTGENVSQLGFGCMRFPTTAEGKIDFARTEEMLDYAIAHGVNYFDTAFPYHGGESEVVTGKILKKYPREQFYVTTKLLMFAVKTVDDARNMLNTQLERLNLGYIDNYYFHGINKMVWPTIKNLGLIDWMQDMKAQGKIRHIGFSFHDEYPLFEEVVNTFDWELCQIQYNYMDTDIQAGDKGVKLCGEKGIPMVIMEPVKGGALARLPEKAEKIMKDYAPDATPASWAVRWVGSHPEVKVVLSGMSTLDQVKDNVATFESFQPLSREELELVAQVKAEIAATQKIGCTGCRYCMPCPNGVDIPGCFRIWNESAKFPNMDGRRAYSRPGNWQARNCVECGLCEDQCPQHLPIREALKQVEAQFGA